MTATVEPSASTAQRPPVEAVASAPPAQAEGIELLGSVHGCGYRHGASLVSRADGQIVQLSQLLYGLLERVDGQRDIEQLAGALSNDIRRRVEPHHVVRLVQKLAEQGLLAGTEHRAPPRRNPLLALRWKVLVTNPVWTTRLTAPLTFLFRPWIMWPVVAAFAVVFWFVLIHKGVASATAQAFHHPVLLLLVFVLAVASAGVHELGHAAACRYGGATPGGMGMGMYLVWPAFYTDVTDTYRLERRARLRVDLAGLYFNALIAVLTMGVWLVVRADALLLLVALQILQMVKQLSPVIRADGYHILSDATGVPDLFAHIGPTLRRLLPRHRREPSALTGRARVIVTAWVLIVVPVLLSLMIGAILVLPRVATTAWDSGSAIAAAMPQQASRTQVIDLLASLVQLVALLLPLLGSMLVTQKVVRMAAVHGRNWSRGSLARGSLVCACSLLMMAGMAWAWWPSGQYRPVRPHGGTLIGLVKLVSSPGAVARPAPPVALLTPGTHLALSMVPVGGATAQHPAMFVILGGQNGPVAIMGGGSGRLLPATAFRFKFSQSRGPNSTVIAVGTRGHAVTYDIAYSLVTVRNGAPVTDRNTAIAVSHCKGCRTVAVSFQVVLVVGRSRTIAPVNRSGALNYHCPACTAAALAEQIVVTLKKQPPHVLLVKLKRALRRLHALYRLGRRGGSLTAVVKQVMQVWHRIETILSHSGLVANPPATSSSSSTTSSSGAGGGSTSPGSPAGTTTAGTTTTSTSTTGTGTTTSTSTTPAGSTTSTGTEGTASTSTTPTTSTSSTTSTATATTAG